MTEFISDKNNGLDYTLVGEVYLPNLISTETNYEIGIWGQRHLHYIKQHRKVFYTSLLTNCQASLAKMKKDTVLINVARAGIVDNNALKKAVENKTIHGAAVDVFENEPCTDSPLRGVKNIILTPHTAPFTKNNFIEMNTLAAENIINFFNGTIERKYLV